MCSILRVSCRYWEEWRTGRERELQSRLRSLPGDLMHSRGRHAALAIPGAASFYLKKDEKMSSYHDSVRRMYERLKQDGMAIRMMEWSASL